MDSTLERSGSDVFVEPKNNSIRIRKQSARRSEQPRKRPPVVQQSNRESPDSTKDSGLLVESVTSNSNVFKEFSKDWLFNEVVTDGNHVKAV
jgi:hypothetical protein